MSTKTYIELLRETSELLSEATQIDDALLSTTAPTARTSLQPLLSEIRIRYTVLLSKLDLVYDQMLQPQKRLIVKRMLEACLGRLIEIKQDLVELHLSDFSFDDDEALQKLQVTPHDAEPIVPQYFIREKEDEINNRYRFIDDILKKLGHEPPKPRPLILTEQQAILIIQRHERARQGRLRPRHPPLETWDDLDFCQRYRLSKETVLWVVTENGNDLKTPTLRNNVICKYCSHCGSTPQELCNNALEISLECLNPLRVKSSNLSPMCIVWDVIVHCSGNKLTNC